MFQGKFRHKRKRLSEFAMKNNNVFEKMRLRKKKIVSTCQECFNELGTCNLII